MDSKLKESQVERLKKYLMTGKSLTPLQAWEFLGIYNFSSRLTELGRTGFQIGDRWVTVINQFHEPVRVKEKFWAFPCQNDNPYSGKKRCEKPCKVCKCDLV